jgi:tetratricopeptide (TPR) repeat protein
MEIFRFKTADFVGPADPQAWPARIAFQQQLGALAASDDGAAAPIPPAMRFVVAALARVLPSVEQRVLTAAPPATASPTRQRSRFVPPQHDPLLRLARGLGVSRFITTNYDLDLERLLCDLGFKGGTPPKGLTAEPAGTVTRTALGAEARDSIFAPERATEMIDFSLHGPDHAVDIVHLHGRVTQPESMLITDDDYLRQYMQRGAQSDLSEQAIALAFTSNPMVFIGSGVSEDDILRPLRQFLTERQSRSDRQAVALMPANGTQARETAETIALYSRYGVLTHHYGVGAVRTKDGDRSVYKPVRWLAEFTTLLGACRQLFEAYIEVCRSLQQAPAAHTLDVANESFQRAGEPLRQDPAASSAASAVKCFRQLSEGLETEDHRLQLPEVRDTALIVIADGPALELHDADPETFGALEMATLTAVAAAAHALAHGAVSIPDGGDLEAVSRQLREAQAFRELAYGLREALVGMALTIKLAALQARHQHWQSGRSRLPQPRPELAPGRTATPAAAGKRPRGPQLTGMKRQHCPVWITTRHPLALKPSPGEADAQGAAQPETRVSTDAPKSDRFFSDAPSQTFQTFSLSMLTRAADEGHLTGRRVFVLYGDRGVGKGHFFEALRTPRRLGEFIEWTWPAHTAPIDYAAAAYFNFSFSLEVVSCFDQINSLLVHRAHQVFDWPKDSPQQRQVEEAQAQLGKNRVALLKHLLKIYSNTPSPKRRVLVALSPFNMLFDERGDAKNAELFRLVDAVLGQDSRKAPIDWLLLCSGSPLPSMFRIPHAPRGPLKHPQINGWATHGPRFELAPLQREDIIPKGARRVADAISRLQARMDGNWAAPAIAQGGSAAAATARRPDAEPQPREALPALDRAWFHVLREAKTANTLAKYFPEVMLCLCLRAGTLYGQRGAVASATASRPVEHLPSDQVAGELSQLILSKSRTFEDADRMVGKLPLTVVEFAAAQALLPGLSDPDGNEKTAGLLDADCRAIYRSLHKSRYLVTLASAVAAELAWPDGSNRTALQVATVVGWWRGLLQSLSSSLANDKPDLIVNQVLNRYHDLHGQALALPRELRLTSLKGHEEALRRVRGPLGWELQQHLLWHLAVAGHPIEADVLAEAPQVRLACRPILDDSRAPEQTAELLCQVLDLMVRRCLIFRIEPAQRNSAPDAPGTDRPNWRFTTHRFMQRAIFRKLHAPHVEHSHVDQFSLSMWATQPDDVPRPNRAAAEQVSNLLAAWTGFPKDPKHVMQASPYHSALHRAAGADDPVQRTLPARLLRASLGVVRTVFSVGVVSHFHDFSTEGQASSEPGGYFEQHRLQVRWLIEQARDLVLAGGLPEDAAPEARAPFFPEEIVWLYNECGLFALVQGRLESAAGYFGVALRAAEKIEPTDAHGALWCRIHLNLAVTDIERGRIREARKNLQVIYSIEDENPILRLLARGYLALVEHYSGNSALAKTWFSEVIEDLDTFGQSRSVAIFSRHLAELYRLGGEADRGEAVRAADRAIAAATKGGHEDVRQLVRLTRVRLAMEDLLSDERDSIARRLDEIERYALDMGMPRLLADITYAKASHLLKLGETRHATSLACKCIQVSTANSLRLRQMTAIGLLGRICEARGFHEASRHLLNRSFALAEACDYSHVRASVRRRHG